ncbi:DUF1501 domain-containing protein [Tautonia sociabilis]|uniref:DUF1501 domain-containing protein n=1 Tax=Tautonia sociabilis TaxID=2080755 RepID=A0A432MJJ1_9BACT|nr:DUF1501 domain-containing protein [Tautonia sociabilis]RUL87561.1 DUF1501 domain-containing protein [Tautonia sociabilis]
MRRHPITPAGLPRHPVVSRRFALQAGALGVLGLGSAHLRALRAADVTDPGSGGDRPARSVIFIFLSGGLGQLDSFDLKPDAPEEVRGEFRPIATSVPGIEICEHLPMLAQRAHRWALVRSLTHPWNEHSQGHMTMLSGRTMLPPGFNASQPKATDWPSIAAVAGALLGPRGNLPPAVVLPERLVHNSGRVIPGQFAGLMGARRDPWFIEASPFDNTYYGAYPEYGFDHQERGKPEPRKVFRAPSLDLPDGLDGGRLRNRLALLDLVDSRRRALDAAAEASAFDAHRSSAVSMLTDPSVRDALDVTAAPEADRDRYGDNLFGWSLLMAKRLVCSGVDLVQVNLGNNETWDTHGNAFPHLKDKLFPPTDRAVSALLDDLEADGLLDSTLVVMAGEFGRTPKISLLPSHYKLPGRDHWGRAQSVFLAGGGIQGGRVLGATDRVGGEPVSDPQRPENFAATIYRALGLPSTAAWHDEQDRPHFIYHGDPFPGLS